MGKVILVGAGPGDPGLLTLRGREALAEADVVVYDRLVGEGVLALIPPGARRIDVGKHAGNHPVPQGEINRILLEEGRKDQVVVRLKGGDPFLFGRGGEELEVLASHGVPFEEVPGISSALAAPAYGGIPVTHREFAASLHIVTGHRRAGEALKIDFEALVRAGGTLVFLMGVAALPELCAGLLAAGMDPETPAALVERGTTPEQRRISAALAALPERAAAERVESPAVFVVGGVCALAEDLDWFSRLPLRGKTILVTRPRERAGPLCRRLRALGARVWEYPTIRLERRPCPVLDAALREGLAEYEWLALTSPAGAEELWARLEALALDARALAGVKLAALGPGTARTLAAHGLRADYVPGTYDAAHLGAGLARLARGKVLLVRAKAGSPALPEALSAAGVAYEDLALYETCWQNAPDPALRRAVEGGEVDLVAFTSASTVRGFAAAVGAGAGLSKILGICLGDPTAAEAAALGIPVRTAGAATVDALVETILEV